MTGILKSYNPATDEILGEVNVTPDSEIENIVNNAKVSAKAWSSMTIATRAECLRKAAESLKQNANELGKLVSQENGKPLRNGIGEAEYSGDYILSHLNEVQEALQPIIKEDSGTKSTIYYDALGVCVAITPWNFPVSMPQWLVFPALMAGNSVILKPSEETPLVAQAYVDIMNEHLPEDVLQIVHGAGDQGKKLISADIDLIVFTGSCATGKVIMKTAADDLKRVILELGGKDPMIILKDADIEKCASIAAENGFENAGQACVSIERIFVDSSVADEFEKSLAAKVSEIRLGQWDDPDADMGPMINQKQRLLVIDQINDALKKGATALTGGAEHPDHFVTPTVLSNVTTEMDIMNEETFGPVVAIYRFDNVGDAIEITNKNPFALGASVFGNNEEAMAVARQIKSGMIGVNKSCFGAFGTPWVGAKQSGYGFHGSIDGHRQFAQTRVISTSK